MLNICCLLFIYLADLALQCLQNFNDKFTVAIANNYRTAQFKLDKTRVWHGLDTTSFSFYMRTSMRIGTRLMMSNLLFKTLVYALDQ